MIRIHSILNSLCTEYTMYWNHYVLNSQCTEIIMFWIHNVLNSQCIEFSMYWIYNVLNLQCTQFTMYSIHDILNSQCFELSIYFNSALWIVIQISKRTYCRLMLDIGSVLSKNIKTVWLSMITVIRQYECPIDLNWMVFIVGLK